jgi:hypothetical protein
MMRSRSIEQDDCQVVASEDMIITGVPMSFSSYDLAEAVKDEAKKPHTQLDYNPQWSVTFEQFLASVLNECCLVDYFDTKVDVVAKLKEFTDTKMKRQESVQVSGSKSVFYA